MLIIGFLFINEIPERAQKL